MSSLKVPHDHDATGKREHSAGTGKGSVAAGSSRLIKTAEQAQQQYLEMVKAIPEVMKVLTVEEDEGLSLLTVISAAPFDDGPRSSVFDVQVDFMQRMEAPLVGFHLLNIQELPGQDLEHQGLESHQVLWSR